MRIALIHALRHSPPSIEAEMARAWPQARVMSLLDTSLAEDLAAEGRLTPRMTERFLALTRYAIGTGADGVLFTCSAFGPCIEACADAFAPIPVLKPNTAMIEDATRYRRVGLLASFQPTLDSMPAEFPPGVEVVPCLIPGAMAALDAGDFAAHDRLAAEAARGLAGCDVIALAQFSLARAEGAVAAATGLPVLTTPGSAVGKLQRILGR